jgi:hypothetical protein
MDAPFEHAYVNIPSAGYALVRTHDRCPGLRSVHAGTNLRSHLGHRFSYGVVSLESMGAPRVLCWGCGGASFTPLLE